MNETDDKPAEPHEPEDQPTKPPESSESAGLAEETIVGRAQDGDVASFEILLRRYQSSIYRLANKMLFDRGDAEDVVQDTFVLVWRRLPTLVDPGVFRSWMYQIATRQCLAVLRARTRRQTQVADAEELQAAHDYRHAQDDQPDDPAASAQYAAQMRGLDLILQTLPDDQRACWVLRELHELTYLEIAYAINLPPPTVRGRIARARQNIAKGMTTWR